jgi:hypothetical protein
VQTTQVAPTILRVLGLDPKLLNAVVLEGTQPLPGFDARRFYTVLAADAARSVRGRP